MKVKKTILAAIFAIFFLTTNSFSDPLNQSCDELLKKIEQNKKDISNSKEALDELRKLYVEMCFSHGGYGMPDCYEMSQTISVIHGKIFRMEEELKITEKQYSNSCNN